VLFRIAVATLIGSAVLSFMDAKAAGIALGIGGKSCAYWQSSPSRQAEGAIWILGYWSGFDDMEQNIQSVGQDIGEQGRIEEVKKTCDALPNISLSEATARTYWELWKRPAKRP
jgi:hypothetical protein